jgi:hypothetical protein
VRRKIQTICREILKAVDGPLSTFSMEVSKSVKFTDSGLPARFYSLRERCVRGSVQGPVSVGNV